MDFVAIDLETANADMASICQIGVVRYASGELVAEWSTLIDPRDYFDPINVGIHGIDESDVNESPVFEEVYSNLAGLLSGNICVSHTHFDRTSLDKAIRRKSLPPLEVTWLDSARVARRAWEECAWRGYGLANVCSLIGFEFKHHDALEDARAAGAVINAAIKRTGLTLDGWLTRVGEPISGDGHKGSLKLEGNPEGELYGQRLVFTGSLAIPRREAAALAASVGCDVAGAVSKKVDYLVVGDQDISRLAGKSKSSKHLRAEELISQGCDIRILMESDFRALVESAHSV